MSIRDRPAEQQRRSAGSACRGRSSTCLERVHGAPEVAQEGDLVSGSWGPAAMPRRYESRMIVIAPRMSTPSMTPSTPPRSSSTKRGVREQRRRLVEALDDQREGDAADDEDGQVAEHPAVLGRELVPVRGQEVAQRVAHVRGEQEREQDRSRGPSRRRIVPWMKPSRNIAASPSTTSRSKMFRCWIKSTTITPRCSDAAPEGAQG